MARSVGLDIGSHSVKLVELDGTPKKFRVSRYVSRAIPGGASAGPEQVAATVGEVLREGRAQRDAVVPALDTSSVVIREIMVPFLQDDQIRRVLRFEAEAHLHSHAIEDVVVDYLKVGEVHDQSKLLIFAAPKDRIRARLALLQQNHADPMHLDLDMTALYNAAKAVGAFEEHPDAVLLDIGASNTLMLFVKDGQLKSCRSIRSGAENLTRVLSQDLSVDTDSARARREQGDLEATREDDLLAPIPVLDDDEEVAEQTAEQLENAVVLQRQEDFLSRIHRETSRTIAIYPTTSTISAIYLTGGAGLSPGLARQIEERFRKPVIPLRFLPEDSSAVPAADFESADAGMGVAFGCALKLLGASTIDLEFRRDELRYTRKFDLIKVSLAAAVSLVFILLFLVWLNLQNNLRYGRKELDDTLELVGRNYVDKARTMFIETIESEEVKNKLRLEADDPGDMIACFARWKSQIAGMHEHITNDMGFNVKGVPPVRSALVLWRNVSDRLHDQRLREQLGYLYIEEIRVTQKLITVEGRIGNRGNIDLIANELSKIQYQWEDGRREDCVEKVERGRTDVDKEGRTRFDLTAELKPTTVQESAPAREEAPR